MTYIVAALKALSSFIQTQVARFSQAVDERDHPLYLSTPGLPGDLR